MASFFILVFAFAAVAQEKFEKDIIKTNAGNLEITFVGHGTLISTFAGKLIHVDPWSRLADYSKMPKADIILLTHDEHRDHLDPQALGILRTEKTVLVLTESCASRIKGSIVINNGDVNKKYGFIQSMRRKGDCWDNTVAESFCSILKSELVYQTSFYNRHRKHPAIGYMNPSRYEDQFWEKWLDRVRFFMENLSFCICFNGAPA